MYANLHPGSIRPRAASVVAVIWLYLGISWALMGLAMAVLSALFASVFVRMGSMGLLFAAWYLAIFGLGVGGTWGAFGLLKLRASGRSLLEAMNWGAACLTAGFSLCWVHGLLDSSWVSDTTMRMAVLGLLTGVLTTVPFLWMAKALRRREVRIACEQFLRDEGQL